MTASILRLRLVEAANYVADYHPNVSLKIEPTFIRMIATRGFYTTHRLVTWDTAEDSVDSNPIITAIDQAVRQLKGKYHDTSMGL